MTQPEPVGTLAEEAAKLFAAVHTWAGAAEPHDVHEVPESSSASGASDCRWCPLCQLVKMAKATSPDVRENLSQAAISLTLALKGLLEDPASTARRAAPLEKIDLTEE